MDIIKATRSYEAWLGGRVSLVAGDLEAKHDVMRQSAFGFLRATYYRWAQVFPELCPEAAAAPTLLGIGDLHLENFGTWRDGEGRLVWGINDFDEAAALPYTNDLIRLATSALVAIADDALPMRGKHACAEILDGYTTTMAAAEARPFVLEERNAPLRDIATSDRHSPAKFWKRLERGPEAEPPPDAKALLLHHLPHGAPDATFRRRVAGAGSLGLPRFVAIRLADRSLVAREAKARAPSARAWAGVGPDDAGAQAEILKRAIRPHDPFLHVTANWIVRRAAPHCERIELAEIADAKGQRAVLNAMGCESANIHRSTKGATAKIRRHLARQREGWLHEAAGAMAQAVRADWKQWRAKG